MRRTVTDGAARPARGRGQVVFGQVGNVSLGPNHDGLRAVWFVGYRGGVAFAVLQFTHATNGSASISRACRPGLPAELAGPALSHHFT